MAPKPIPLAYAGRKLTGPPEAYGHKKELQVKKWLSKIPDQTDSNSAIEGQGSVSDATQNLDPSVEQLYFELRDSTDGFSALLPSSSANRARPAVNRNLSGAEQQQFATDRKVSNSISRNNGLQSSKQDSPIVTQVHEQPFQPENASTRPRTPEAPLNVNHMSIPVNQSLGATSAYSIIESNVVGNTVKASIQLDNKQVQNQQSAQGVVAQNTISIPQQQSLNAASPARDAGANVQRTSVNASVVNLNDVLLGDVDLERSAAITAEILIGRVEASVPSNTSETEKLRRALLLSLTERQQFMQEVRAELAKARVGLSQTEKNESQKAASLEADLAALKTRAESAEAELQRVRAEAVQLAVQARAHEAEVDDKNGETTKQVESLRSGLAEINARLKATGEQSERAAAAAENNARAANQRAAAAEREAARIKRQFEIDRARMEVELAGLQTQLLEFQNEIASSRRDRDAAIAAAGKEAAARKQAEESERRALAAAAAAATVAGGLREAGIAESNVAARRNAVSIREGVIRAADPVAALVTQQGASANHAGAKGVQGVGMTSHAVSAPEHVQHSPRSSQQAGRSSSPTKGLAVAAEFPSVGVLSKSPRKIYGGEGGKIGTEEPSGFSRREQHRAIQKAVVGEKHKLGEALRDQRRLQAAVALEESAQVERALSAAPPHLRTLGLAFRAYVCAETVAVDSVAAKLAAQLSTDYRTYLDPVLMQASPEEVAAAMYLPSAPLVALSAAVILFASAGLLNVPQHAAELNEAALHEIPIIVLAPESLDPSSLCTAPRTADGQAPSRDPWADIPIRTQQYLREAWSHCIRLTPNLRVNSISSVIAERLGLTDPQLRALPHEVLKKIARGAGASGVPDLIYLNSPKLTALKLTAPAKAWAGPKEEAESNLSSATLLGPAILGALRGNTSLTSLSLKGLVYTDLEAITTMALAPTCAVMTITINAEIPVGVLAGKSGRYVAELDLSRAPPLSSEDAAVLAVALTSASDHLRILNLPVATSHMTVEVANRLADTVARLPKLERINGSDIQLAMRRWQEGAIDFSSTPLGLVAALVLGRRLRQVTPLAPLNTLNLTGCQAGADAVSFLVASPTDPAGASSSNHLSFLTTASLADNALGQAGCVAAVDSLSRGGAGASLALLDMSLNSINDPGCRALSKSLPAFLGLACLALSHNKIGNDGIRALAPAIGSLTGLAELHLSGNTMGDSGIAALAPALARLSILSALHLNHNYSLGSDGLKPLLTSLQSCPDLAMLDLSRNPIGPDAGKALAAALPNLPSLSTLILEHVSLRTEGVESLAFSLAGCSSLTRLVLARNGAGDHGAKAIASALERNRSLVYLDLSTNTIGNVGARFLMSALRSYNTILRTLIMTGNEVEEPVMKALEHLVTSSRSPARVQYLGFGKAAVPAISNHMQPSHQQQQPERSVAVVAQHLVQNNQGHSSPQQQQQQSEKPLAASPQYSVQNGQGAKPVLKKKMSASIAQDISAGFGSSADEVLLDSVMGQTSITHDESRHRISRVSDEDTLEASLARYTTTSISQPVTHSPSRASSSHAASSINRNAVGAGKSPALASSNDKAYQGPARLSDAAASRGSPRMQAEKLGGAGEHFSFSRDAPKAARDQAAAGSVEEEPLEALLDRYRRSTFEEQSAKPLIDLGYTGM